MKSLASLLKIFICGFIVFIGALNSQAAADGNVQAAKKIYYMIASAKGFGQSAFGHAYLRMGFYNTPHPDDLVLELVADVKSSDLSILRGLGLGENYARAVVLEKYINAQYELNYLQNRDLVSTEILLTDAQRSLILQRIATLAKQGHMGDYAFATKNCAQGIATLLSNLNFDSNLLDSPRNVLARLKAHGLTGKVYTDLGLSGKNLELVAKYQGLLEKIEKADPDFRKDLFAGSFSEQTLAYAQIKNAITRLAPAEQTQALRFLKSMAYLQPRFARNDLLDLANGRINYQVVKLGTRSLDVDDGEQFSIRRWKFISQAGNVTARVTVDSSGATKKDKYNRQDLDVDAFSLQLKGSEILLNSQSIGVLHSNSVAADENGVLFKNANAVPVLYERARGSRFQELALFLVVDSQELPAPTEVAATDVLPLLNDAPSMPSCYGLVDLQKALLERATFLPEAPQLAPAEYLALLRSLLFAKNLVYFPGVRNIADLIKIVSPLSVRRMVYEYHMNVYGGAWAALTTYFKSSGLSKGEDLESLRAMADYGLYFTVSFRVYKNGQKTNIGHALLVKSMTRKGSRYYLNAYDPNLGLFSSDLFYIDAVTGKFHTTFYGVTDARVISPDFDTSLTSLKLKQGANATLLKIYTEQTKTYSVSIPQMLMMM